MGYRTLSAGNIDEGAQKINTFLFMLLFSSNQFPRPIGQSKPEGREILGDMVHLGHPPRSVSWVENVSGPTSVVLY